MLRDLERTFAQTGEVRLLTHRVRAGLLPTAWLETAARLGHEAARRAPGRFVPTIALGAVPEHLGVAASASQLGGILGTIEGLVLRPRA